MKDTGITRYIDNLGRITIPREILASHDIMPKQKAEIYVEGNDVIVEKPDVDAGVVRRIDPLGRLTIPREVLNRFGLKCSRKGVKGSAVRFLVDGQKIIVRKELDELHE